MPTLYYIHDPMCSWCWGYNPTWDKLQQHLPSSVNVEYVVGGLAPDSDSPMPEAQQQMIENHWRNIEAKLGTQFNYDFWSKNTPRRSTYNSCRAAIAAHNQGYQAEMIKAIQQAYYLNALNPSDIEVLSNAAKTLNASDAILFDITKFNDDLTSANTEKELLRQINFARNISQQGFPSLVLGDNGKYHQIRLDYLNFEISLEDILSKLNSA